MYWNLSGLLTVAVLSGTIVAPAPGAARPADAVADRAPIPVAAEQPEAAAATAVQTAGTIEGTLTIRPRPPRRTVNRYGGAPTMAHVQEIPPVVFLQGRIGAAPQPATGAMMAQEDTAFVPALLVVPVGTTIRFPNQDAFFHNVFSYSAGGRFDLGRYPMGESKDVTFSDPGIVKVYCEVHESMRAGIVVVQNGFWARPGEDGSFRIQGVPAGTYTMVAWQADRGETEQEVVVPADGVVRVELEL